ncbi:hypothetical protein [Desertimonas flava]|uniref:hypothetical protein n=1 Tax=Desertimonas flava TaxID=2064846 RepID=UPI000E352833|nr:hypothetical protein [Desertimonas flava]
MIIVLVIVVLLAIVLVVGVLGLRRMVGGAQRRAVDSLAGHKVVTAEPARSLGVSSRGKRQVRGTGTLALCHDRVIFVQWVPHSVVDMPFTTITSADTTTSHLGKSVGSPVLRLSWMTPDGVDQLAVQVRDPQRWLTALRSAGVG